MNLKPLAITVAILAILSGITWFTTRPPTPVRESGDRTGEDTVPRDLIANATRITITDGGKTVELAQGTGLTWRVASYHDLPVDFAKLTRFVSQLTGTKIERFVTASPERIKRLGLDTARIIFHGADVPPFTLELGRTTENGGRFIRRAGESRAYLAHFDLWLDAEPKNWADSTLVTLTRNDIARVELAFPGTSTLAFARKDKAEFFTVDPARNDQRLKPAALDALLDTLVSLRFKDTTDSTASDVADARKHSRTITLTTFDKRVLTLTMGRRPASTSKDSQHEKAAPEVTATTTQHSVPNEEGTPAGPVYIWIDDTKNDSPIARLMKERAVEISEQSFTNLPTIPDDLLEKNGIKTGKP